MYLGIVSSLPTDPVEWKRSYGRTTKSVYVEVEFQPFHVDSLMKVTNMICILLYNLVCINCNVISIASFFNAISGYDVLSTCSEFGARIADFRSHSTTCFTQEEVY